jgi:hypothetical protein
MVPVTALPDSRPRNKREDRQYLRSKDVRDREFSEKLEMDCCPLKVLQKHNVFGHSSVQDYCYWAFDRLTRARGIEVDPEDRDEWRAGHVHLTGIHLTANFECPAHQVRAIIDAIDQNNPKGKHRDGVLCISLGFTDKRRSVYHTVTIYYKPEELKKEWKTRGEYQNRIFDWATNSIRVEVKLYSQFLKRRGLQRISDWQNVDVAALFFEVLASYEITYAIQPEATAEQLQLLSKKERTAYLLWLSGQSLRDHYGRTTAWKLTRGIRSKIDIDVSGEKRPERAPKVHLKDIFRPEKVLPIPQWILDTPYYHRATLGNERGRPFGPNISDVVLPMKILPDEVIEVDGELRVI